MAAFIPAILAIAGAVASGVQAKQQAEAEQERLERAAAVEELNRRREALAVSEELLHTLSKNTVAAAAGGLMSSGSVARAQEANQAKAADELSVNRFNSEQRAEDLRLTGKQVATRGKHALAGSLFDAAAKSVQTYKIVKRT